MPKASRWHASDLGALMFPAATIGLIVAACLPSDALDGLPPICLFRNFGGFECPGCGMTRALWRLLHLEFDRALELNWRVTIVAPLLAGLYGRWGYRFLRRFRADGATPAGH